MSYGMMTTIQLGNKIRPKTNNHEWSHLFDRFYIYNAKKTSCMQMILRRETR